MRHLTAEAGTDFGLGDGSNSMMMMMNLAPENANSNNHQLHNHYIHNEGIVNDRISTRQSISDQNHALCNFSY